jgi:hypothetical protein
MAIPYQPTFALQPKHGFRYGPSAFAPATAPINAPPPPLGLQGSAAAPPPVMGTQQGPAYSNDPFGGNDFQQQPNYEPAAQKLGYTKGTQNPLGILQAVPVLGTAMGAMGAFDNMPNQTYGNYQTYDAQGNVFGTEGRAYNPVTGQAAQSYGSTGDWMGGWLGIGTPEGAFGSSSSYGKLKAAGENPFNSFFGSYDNSTYNVPNYMNAYGSSAADKAGVDTINSRVAFNTQMATGNPMYGYAEDDLDRLNNTAFTDASQFGFSPTTGRYSTAQRAIDAANGNVTYGTGAGNYFSTSGKGVGGSEQSGFINESGQVVTPDGTMVSITDALGNKQSLLNTPTQNFQTLQNIQNVAEALNPETGESNDSDWGTGGFGGGGSFGTSTSSGDFDVSNAQSYTNDIDDIEEATGKAYDDPSNNSGNDGGK